ncbi:MAG: hypothetical protein AB7I48_05630 [Planctomycetaceae bacterium]
MYIRQPRRAGVLGGLMVAIGCWSCVPASAQTEAAPERSAVRLEVNRSLSHTHVPNRFSLLPHRLTNERNEPFDGLCITTFEDRHNLQYGRRIVVPPQARLITWQPILVPDAPASDPYDPKIREIPFRSLLFDRGASEEQIVRQEAGSMQLRDTLWLAHAGQVTGVLLPARAEEDARSGISLYDLVKTGRLEQGLPYNYVELDESLPPGGEESLAAFDQFVVADSRILDDLGAVHALRRWLYGGGRLWVMLDRVDVQLLEALLGDQWTSSVIDRVGLTSVQLEVGPGQPPNDEQRREFDRPVDLVRMLADGVETAYTTGGWPAAVWKPCGEGMLLVTTLGADAWVRPRLPTDPDPPRNPSLKTAFVPGPALDDLSAAFFVPRSGPLLDQESLETQSRDSVGYTVPSRGLVVGMLSGFTLMLIGVGGWLLKTGEAQRLGVFGPLAALAASLSLMAVGRAHRSLSETTAVTQFVQPISGTSDVRASGAAATFVGETGHAEYSGGGGWLLPATTEQDGGTRRIVWSGLDRWRWESLPLTQGLHASRFWSAAELFARSSVRAVIDAEGITGRLTLPDGLTATDPILVTPHGRMGVDMTGADSFRSRAADLLSAGQYVAAGLLTDEQSARGGTLAALLESTGDRFPSGPTLLFWTDPWNLGISFPSEGEVSGSALVALPMSLDRPPAGTAIDVPAPFVNYREGPGPQSEHQSGLYDHRTRTWMDRTKPAMTWLHFRLPPGLTPVRPTGARLTIRVLGSMRRLEVAARQRDQVVPVRTWSNPVGTLSLDINDPDLLELTPEGHLMLRIAMGDPDQPSGLPVIESGSAEPFRIESLALEIRAVVLEDEPVPSTSTLN